MLCCVSAVRTAGLNAALAAEQAGARREHVGVRMSRSKKDKMLAGEMYRPGDPEIEADQTATKKWLVRYNTSLASSAAERRVLLAERFARSRSRRRRAPAFLLRLRLQHSARRRCLPQLQLRDP